MFWIASWAGGGTLQRSTAIIGGGLAGTSLAWRLHRLGESVTVIDPVEPNSSSRVAAGLITPVAGQRFVVSWRYDEAWPIAEAYYREVESLSGTMLLVDRPMTRLIENEREAGFWAIKRESLPRHLWRELEPGELPDTIHAPLGGVVLPAAARLDVAGYLDATRQLLAATGGCRFLTGRIRLPEDLHYSGGMWHVEPLGVQVTRVVFCQGFEARGNPWFDGLSFNPSKGEILDIEVPGLVASHTIHRGVWLVPATNSAWRAGSTYTWHDTSAFPTESGCAEIVERLERFLKMPFQVTKQSAGIRPNIHGFTPVIGSHPTVDGLAFFNGLGSKGSLLAPMMSDQLARHLVLGEPVSRDVDVRFRMRGERS